MPNGARMNDRFGLPISTSSSTAADHYLEGLDLLLSQNFGHRGTVSTGNRCR